MRKCLGSAAMSDLMSPFRDDNSTASRDSTLHSLTTTMSGAPGPSNPGRAIASLAKMPADTTRAGTQKMKFVPTLPPRRKKEYVTSSESSTVHTLLISRPIGRNLHHHRPPPQVVHLLSAAAGAKGVVVGAATRREVGVEPHPRDRPSRR
jgi:hypothetical protein